MTEREWIKPTELVSLTNYASNKAPFLDVIRLNRANDCFNAIH